jgi:hypothetical protein
MYSLITLNETFVLFYQWTNMALLFDHDEAIYMPLKRQK